MLTQQLKSLTTKKGSLKASKLAINLSSWAGQFGGAKVLACSWNEALQYCVA